MSVLEGWLGQVLREPGQVRKKAAATILTWVEFTLPLILFFFRAVTLF